MENEDWKKEWNQMFEKIGKEIDFAMKFAASTVLVIGSVATSLIMYDYYKNNDIPETKYALSETLEKRVEASPEPIQVTETMIIDEKEFSYKYTASNRRLYGPSEIVSPTTSSECVSISPFVMPTEVIMCLDSETEYLTIFNRYNGRKKQVLEGKINDPEMRPHFQVYERKMQLLEDARLK